MAPFKRQITYSSRPNHRARVAHSMGDRQFRTYDTSALQPKRSKGPMIAFVAVIVVVALLLILGVSTLIRGCTSGNLVADGQQVKRGDVVGATGSTGYATGAHVHFQVAQDGAYIDPMSLPGF